MNIVINTNYKGFGALFFTQEIGPRLTKAGHSVTYNDWGHYGKYNLALFMATDSDVKKAKKINPVIFTGIIDPKLTRKRQVNESKLADFLAVTSLEQKDIFLQYNQNIFILYLVPEIKEAPKVHTDKDKILIGYHGNKLHLNCMNNLRRALDALSQKYAIEFWAMYNVKNLGKWKKNVPKKCPIKHIQWSPQNYYKYLSKTDIGVVPAKIPLALTRGRLTTKLFSSYIKNWPGYFKYDYLMRFKYSTNPERAYVFGQLHIPVVADFMPSYCQIIQNGYSGCLVYSKEGWYYALEKLIRSAELRNKMSKNLKDFINKNCSPDINFKNFLEFINSLQKERI
ncbi:hypothetical protein MYX07_04605 [Patescibacteria group bacterium AH-259-L07]|nr:hypothetical protein [Patescibacteria group bacterium AH-259-L07]